MLPRRCHVLQMNKSEQARQIDSSRSSQASDLGILRWEQDIKYGCVSNLGTFEKYAIFFERPIWCFAKDAANKMAGWFDPHAHVLPSNRHRQSSQLRGLERFHGHPVVRHNLIPGTMSAFQMQKVQAHCTSNLH